jgi:dTDP-3-amino-3,4,6-trideoxy-alpha-D-glucose transaminase
VWHLYVVRTRRRTELMAALDKAGIGSLIHYPIPPHLQQAYADLGWPAGSFPLAEELAETVLSLPMGAHMPETAVDEVAAVVRATLRA